MRVSKLINTSDKRVTVVHQDGITTSLPPGAKITNVDIVNEKELRGKVTIVANLTEVIRGKGKSLLYD